MSSEFQGIQLTKNLKDNYGVFVTLKKKGNLRGCIGFIGPYAPLYQGVMENTISAASRDYRFPPVAKNEAKEIRIEISVLTNPQRVPHYTDILPGRDGIILKKENKSAVFLPQVLVEENWTLFTALRHLSQKAGLYPEAWREGAEFYTFRAQIFHE